MKLLEDMRVKPCQDFADFDAYRIDWREQFGDEENKGTCVMSGVPHREHPPGAGYGWPWLNSDEKNKQMWEIVRLSHAAQLIPRSPGGYGRPWSKIHHFIATSFLVAGLDDAEITRRMEDTEPARPTPEWVKQQVEERASTPRKSEAVVVHPSPL